MTLLNWKRLLPLCSLFFLAVPVAKSATVEVVDYKVDRAGTIVEFTVDVTYDYEEFHIYDPQPYGPPYLASTDNNPTHSNPDVDVAKEWVLFDPPLPPQWIVTTNETTERFTYNALHEYVFLEVWDETGYTHKELVSFIEYIDTDGEEDVLIETVNNYSYTSNYAFFRSAYVVPVPAAFWLFGSALAGLGWMRRRQK